MDFSSIEKLDDPLVASEYGVSNFKGIFAYIFANHMISI